MQFKKGKILFGHKDTWSMNEQLSKVILAGVTKYKEVIDVNPECKGIPFSISNALEEKGEITFTEDYDLSDEDVKKCEDYFNYVLDEIIFSFGDNEPDIMEYDFHYELIREEPEDFTISTTDQKEADRYMEDMNVYRERCLEGRKLFVEHFEDLWW